MRLRDRHRWKAAAAEFARLVEEQPTNAEAHFWLAVSLDNRGEERAAVPAYRRALALGLPSPLQERALSWLASSLSKTGAHAEAIESISNAELAGGYEPREEYERIQRSIWRRSAPR